MVCLSNGLSLHSGTSSFHTKTGQHFHNLWCSQCQTAGPQLAMHRYLSLPKDLGSLWTSFLDDLYCLLRSWVTSDQGKWALVTHWRQSPATCLYYTSGYQRLWSCLQAWEPMLLRDFLLGMSVSAFPSVLLGPSRDRLYPWHFQALAV